MTLIRVQPPVEAMWRGASVLALAWIAGSGCGEPNRPAVASDAQLSACRNIAIEELGCFRRGEEMQHVLGALGGRGNFEFAYREPSGDAIQCSSYAVCWGSGPFANSAYVVWAIYRNGRFEKLVDWVKPSLEQVPYQGTTRSRYVQLSVNENLERARAAVDQPPVDVASIRSRVERGPGEVQPDWGLTIAFLLFARTNEARQVRDLERNAVLRGRFDGTAARLGASLQDVEGTYGRPIEEWHEDGTTVRVYGSEERFELLPGLHFSPVVVAYRDSEVAVEFSNEFVPAILGEE